jgi:hypothetical protein
MDTPDEVKEEDLEQYMRSMLEWGEKVNEKAKNNIVIAQQMQKKRYDALHKPPSFEVGDMVWRYNGRKDTRKGGKLDWSWTGPYKILARTKRGTYHLQNQSGLNLKQAVSSIHLKAVIAQPRYETHDRHTCAHQSLFAMFRLLQENDVYQYCSSDENSESVGSSQVQRKRKRKRKKIKLSNFVITSPLNPTSSAMQGS